MDPSDSMTDFLKLLSTGREAMGSNGQMYNGMVRQFAQSMGLNPSDAEDLMKASGMLNDAMNSATRQSSSTLSAYSDSDVTSKFNSMLGMFKDPKAATAKLMSKFTPDKANGLASGAPESFASRGGMDMSSRANLATIPGDILSSYAMQQYANGPSEDPLAQFARYIMSNGQTPRPTGPREVL